MFKLFVKSFLENRVVIQHQRFHDFPKYSRDINVKSILMGQRHRHSTNYTVQNGRSIKEE